MSPVTKLTFSCLLALAVSGTGLAGPLDGLGAAAEGVRAPDRLLDTRAGSSMSAAQAAKEARRRHGGGRVLDVDEVSGGYRVKLLQNGDVRIVFVGR